ncbi:hypothetical protein LIER_25118 [Lithospermum erythrorhizon]|uniref:Uncharacterized protein n=1 Tax=Lithospermum erythrorhizon TaxID=34254 RepID=A0AAV3R6K4_LITER
MRRILRQCCPWTSCPSILKPRMDNIQKTLSELDYVATEVLAHLVDGQAFSFPFLPMLLHGIERYFPFLPMLLHGKERYFEGVTRALQIVREADFGRLFHPITLDRALHEAEVHFHHSQEYLAEAVQYLANDDAYYRAKLSAGAPAADIEVARRLVAWDRNMVWRSCLRLCEAREEVDIITRAIRYSQGEDAIIDTLLSSLELVHRALEDIVPERLS